MKVAQYVVIIIICLTYHLADVVCSNPEYMFNEEVGGWFKLHMFPLTWQDAFIRCQHEGAVLASPINNQLAHALHTLMADNGRNRIFLGIHALFGGGELVSVEGVPVADMAIKWGSQNSKIAHGSCLIMSSEINNCYVMYASSCTEPLPYICYRKFDNRTINECGTYDNEYQYKQSTGSCYKVHTRKQDWFTAYKICASEGAYLVILNDDQEARVVRALIQDKSHIGLVAWGVERIWLTIHGDRIEDVFHRWQPGEPNNGGGKQDRAALYHREGTLDDVEAVADVKLVFVCEKSPDSIRFETPQVDTIIL